MHGCYIVHTLSGIVFQRGFAGELFLVVPLAFVLTAIHLLLHAPGNVGWLTVEDTGILKIAQHLTDGLVALLLGAHFLRERIALFSAKGIIPELVHPCHAVTLVEVCRHARTNILDERKSLLLHLLQILLLLHLGYLTFLFGHLTIEHHNGLVQQVGKVFG